MSLPFINVPFENRLHGVVALIVAGVILIGYSGFLVVVNYQSQARLEDTAVSRFLQSLDNESISLRFFFPTARRTCRIW